MTHLACDFLPFSNLNGIDTVLVLRCQIPTTVSHNSHSLFTRSNKVTYKIHQLFLVDLNKISGFYRPMPLLQCSRYVTLGSDCISKKLF